MKLGWGHHHKQNQIVALTVQSKLKQLQYFKKMNAKQFVLNIYSLLFQEIQKLATLIELQTIIISVRDPDQRQNMSWLVGITLTCKRASNWSLECPIQVTLCASPQCELFELQERRKQKWNGVDLGLKPGTVIGLGFWEVVLGFMGLDCVLDWALTLGGPILVPSETLVIIYDLWPTWNCSWMFLNRLSEIRWKFKKIYVTWNLHVYKLEFHAHSFLHTSNWRIWGPYPLHTSKIQFMDGFWTVLGIQITIWCMQYVEILRRHNTKPYVFSAYTMTYPCFITKFKHIVPKRLLFSAHCQMIHWDMKANAPLISTELWYNILGK